MLSTLNILSRTQGKIRPEGETEDAFYSRFARETPPPEDREFWHFMGFEFLALQRRHPTKPE